MRAQTTHNNRRIVPHLELTLGFFSLSVNTFAGVILTVVVVMASLIFGLTYLLK